MPEPLGDVIASRENLLKTAYGCTGQLQAIEGFLRDREDLSREGIADEVKAVWERLNDRAELTPSMYPAGVEPKDEQS